MERLIKIFYTSIIVVIPVVCYVFYKKNINNKQKQQQQIKEIPKQFPREWNDLLIGAYTDDIKKIDNYLNNNGDINFKDEKGWTALHIAVSNKSLNAIKLLIENGIDYKIQTQDKGYTSLHIASSNGNLDIVKLMIELNKIPSSSLLSNDMETTLLMSITNNHCEISELLLNYYSKQSDRNQSKKEFKKYIDQYNANGVSPFIMCILRNNIKILKLLVSMECDINSFKKDNSNGLHCASNLNLHQLIEYLIEIGTNSETFNRYGNAPIHESCIKSNCESIETFVRMNKSLAILPDKDGSSPLHLSCNCSMSKDIMRNLKSIKIIHEIGEADLNQLDNGGATPLHVLSCNDDKVLPLVQYLLDNNVDTTIENKHGWSSLHQSYNNKNAKEIYQTIYKYTKEKYPKYIESFNPEKKKEIKSINQDLLYSTNKEELNKIGLNRLKEISDNIKNGKIKKVICLTGSGISANSGIPPYRTKDGLLNKNQQFSFSMDILKNQPELFYDTLRKYFYPATKDDSNIFPTDCHRFINQLSNNSILLRNYTQNVDPLQERTGTPDELIVHAHGSFKKWYCIGCNKEYDSNKSWNEIGRGGLPFCTESYCREIIRPNVVFFGEPLPIEFKRYSISDFRECDLLIILGTSLQVYPFAGLVNDVSINTPRILINYESTGCFRNTNDLLSSNNSNNSIDNNDRSDNNKLIIESRGIRDVVVLGDCDTGSNYLKDLFFN